MSLTSPLGLMRRLRRPDLRLEVVPWLNVLAIAWMLTLLGGRFIYAPGVPILLDASGSALPARTQPPVVPGGALPGRPTDAVLRAVTVGEETKFLLGGGITTLTTLPEPLRRERANLPSGRAPVLLFIPSRNLPLETFLRVLDMAREAGFEVQVAAQDAPGASQPENP